jgi:hypothetical protein
MTTYLVIDQSGRVLFTYQSDKKDIDDVKVQLMEHITDWLAEGTWIVREKGKEHSVTRFSYSLPTKTR